MGIKRKVKRKTKRKGYPLILAERSKNEKRN